MLASTPVRTLAPARPARAMPLPGAGRAPRAAFRCRRALAPPRAERAQPLGDEGKLVSDGTVVCRVIGGGACRRGVAAAPASARRPAVPSPSPQAPVTPQTAVGEQLAYLLKMEPHLFRAAVDAELARISAERADRAAAAAAADDDLKGKPPRDSASLVLYKRMDDLRRGEQALSVRDLMYACVLERFHELRVPMLPTLSDAPPEAPADLTALTEGVHSAEALDLVKDHVRGALAPRPPRSPTPSSACPACKPPKCTPPRSYLATSCGGSTPGSSWSARRGLLPGDAVARLEALFSAADAADAGAGTDLDAATPVDPAAVAAAAAAAYPRGGSALRAYIESFDADALASTARVVSAEGAPSSKPKSGPVRRPRAPAAPDGGSGRRRRESMDDLMPASRKRSPGTVDTVALTAGTQRRAVLEAVAYGAFLGTWRRTSRPITRACSRRRATGRATGAGAGPAGGMMVGVGVVGVAAAAAGGASPCRQGGPAGDDRHALTRAGLVWG